MGTIEEHQKDVLAVDYADGKIYSSANANANANANGDGDVAVVSDNGYLRMGHVTPTGAAWTQTLEPVSGRVLMNSVTLDDAQRLVVTDSHDQALHLFHDLPDGPWMPWAYAMGPPTAS